MEVSAKGLRGLGLIDAARAEQFLADLPGEFDTWLLPLSACADPDLALLQVLRLHEADPSLLGRILSAGGDRLSRLLAVLGISQWWGDYLIVEPARCEGLWVEPGPARDELLTAVGADLDAAVPVAAPGRTGDDLRRAYRRVQLDLVADDATCPDSAAFVPEVGRRMADLADAALEAALALARRDIDPDGTVAFAIIAMGKTGARELNYISDVDVVYVVEPGEDEDERRAVEIGTRLAAMSAQACSGAGAEQPLWTVDANLRPEGRNGALVRTLDSFVAYWRQWAQNWEFQALLKARACAGDRNLGERFEREAATFIWNAAGRDGFVESARQMRKRVEASIPRRDADREIKLGRGGLRDVEFTVQLLQLVHGRTDESLAVRATVDAIGALAAGGYIGRTNGAELSACYCFLRALEHRAQLARMRRTHLVPSRSGELRVTGRALDREKLGSAEALTEELARVRTRVRQLHEDVFYRPIISATAGLSADVAALDAEGARARLAAIGYRDPGGALAHIAALTQGTSRRAKIQRHLLPVFISWLVDGADPDLGLLNFRALSEQIGDSHWYLGLLRDSGLAASRLCAMLPTSRWIAEGLSHRPDAVAWLDSDADLDSRGTDLLVQETASLVGRHPESEAAAERIRSVRSRELLRAAMADMLCGIEATRTSIADATDAALIGALAVAQREDVEKWGGARAEVGLVAMGRYGGRESSYASDADVVAVHRATRGVSEAEAAESATAVINRMRSLLGSVTTQLSIGVDLDLRPEGRCGPMTRTVSSFRDYYERWSNTWERQALLRARPVAGPADLLNEFMALADEIRYCGCPGPDELKEIRLLKARMETERLPRGADPARHVKLGPGGLTDVEWVVQLLQLRHAHEVEALRTPSTIEALDAALNAGLIGVDDAAALRTAWELASRVRAANVLTTGRMSGAKLDVLPREIRDLGPLSRTLGYPSGRAADLSEDWMRAARKCRAVMDRLFWE